MKLYATITSERASKGQGGNEYIDIDLFDGYKNLIGRVVLMEDGQNPKGYVLVEDIGLRHPSLRIDVENGKGVEGGKYMTLKSSAKYPEKGEKQKGEVLGQKCPVPECTRKPINGYTCKFHSGY